MTSRSRIGILLFILADVVIVIAMRGEAAPILVTIDLALTAVLFALVVAEYVITELRPVRPILRPQEADRSSTVDALAGAVAAVPSPVFTPHPTPAPAPVVESMLDDAWDMTGGLPPARIAVTTADDLSYKSELEQALQAMTK